MSCHNRCGLYNCRPASQFWLRLEDTPGAALDQRRPPMNLPAPSPPPLLNEPQLAAVTHVDGPLLIFAGAGSGKTRTLTYRIAHLIAHHRVAPYRILAVTFTNKAAAEMRHRLEAIVGADIARDLWVGTFHGICAKFLRRCPELVGLSPNFVIYDDSDQ